MRNRAAVPSSDLPTHERERGDVAPRRLAIVFALFCLSAIVIGVRLAWIQTQLGVTYVQPFEQTSVRREPIPAPDGRILSAEGDVLAHDVVRFNLEVHYRWLEEPPNPLWLRQKSLARLDRADRRNRAKVRQATADVLEERAALWQRLTDVASLDARRMAVLRSDIQQRVERIRDSAQRRAIERESGTPDIAEASPRVGDNGWMGLAQSIYNALTTPPPRENREPLVVREEQEYHTLLAEIPPEVATGVDAQPKSYPGVRIATSTQRRYPLGGVAPHVVGVRTPLDEAAAKARRERSSTGDPLGYTAGDRIGRDGIEASYDTAIHGIPGERELVFDHRGEQISSRVVREVRAGQDVVLSLQVAVQSRAEQLLDEALSGAHLDSPEAPQARPVGGSIVAIDVRTGAVLALASAPRFDASLFQSGDPVAWEAVLADPRKPLFHRAVGMTLPPGSVFKAVTAAAILEEGVIEPQGPFFCQGYLENPSRFRCMIFRRSKVGHGDIGLVDALARSCNVYFFHAARRLKPDDLQHWARRFGLGERTGIDLPSEQSGQVPDHGPRPGLAQRLQLSIGQDQLTVSPIQAARMMAAIANGGRLVTPYVVERVGTVRSIDAGTSQTVDTSRGESRATGVSKRTLDWVKLGLAQVVAHPQGTGHKAIHLDEVAIAGKTGTAEAGGGRPDHAWFAGYAPAESPRVAFVVVLEHAGNGGQAAGPLARKFVQSLLAEGLLGDRKLTSTAP